MAMTTVQESLKVHIFKNLYPCSLVIMKYATVTAGFTFEEKIIIFVSRF